MHKWIHYKGITYINVVKINVYSTVCNFNCSFFEATADVNQQNIDKNLPNELKTIDFKGESITFRATTAAILTTLQHCLEIINQRDELWKKKVDREIERRKISEELYK